MNMKKAGLLSLLLMCALLLSGCGGFKFEGRALPSGKVGADYRESVALDQDGMYYELDYTDTLPLGLYLSEEGEISGVPEEAGDFAFTLVAINSKNDFREAEFTLTIEKGVIAYAGKALPDAVQEEPYVQSVASASGVPGITYAAKGALPDGLTLSPAGEISGVPAAAAQSASFTVVASASGADPVEALFTLTIAEPAVKEGATDLGYIVYEGFALPDGLVGQAYNESIRTAYGVPDITYKVKYIGGIGFPKGVKFNSLGTVTGTPANSTSGVMRFNVIASAPGVESVTAEFSVHIRDVYVATSRMEAEHIDVSALKGAGYSGSASGLAMLQSYPKASGGKALGYLNCATAFEFRVEAAADTAATLVLGAATEWGDLTLTPETFKIFINGEELAYGSFTMPEMGYGSQMEFQRFPLEPAIQLRAGENVIRFEIFDSVDTQGVGTSTAKGPIFDYLEIQGAGCEIGWRPRVANTK